MWATRVGQVFGNCGGGVRLVHFAQVSVQTKDANRDDGTHSKCRCDEEAHKPKNGACVGPFVPLVKLRHKECALLQDFALSGGHLMCFV